MRHSRSKVQSPRSLVAGRWATLCVLAAALTVVGAAAQDQEELVRDIAAHLRCPVCQNLSVADSPSELANQMRGVIRDRLRAGDSREQIEAYFVEKYGEWVLLAPKKRGFNLLAWVLPFIGVVGGVFAVAVMARRWAAARDARKSDPPPQVSPEDEPYRERVRRELDEFAR